MWSRIFKSEKGQVLGQDADFKQRVLAKLDDYLKPFENPTNTFAEKIYVKRHSNGGPRARLYLDSINVIQDEKTLMRKVFNDVYAGKSSELETSKELRRYLEAALCEHFNVSDKVMKAAERDAINELYAAYYGDAPMPSTVTAVQQQARRAVLLSRLKDANVFAASSSPEHYGDVAMSALNGRN